MQIDLFSGDLVDTRTRRQKQRAEEQAQPKQAEMFSQRELAQFGVRARPKLPISPKTRIELKIEDRRTEEEKERDRQREAERLTYPLPGIGPERSGMPENDDHEAKQNGGE